MNVATLDYISILLITILIIASIQDIFSRRISNLFPVIIVASFIIYNFITGWNPEIWKNIASFGLILAVGSILFHKGFLGGGDVKLWAAVALWFRPAQLPLLILSITLAGGLMALFSIGRRALRRHAAASHDGAIPYGVAIALGTIATISIAGAGFQPNPEPSAVYQELDRALMQTVSGPTTPPSPGP